MPYGDGTGPDGFGSMTGRRLGFCTGNDRPGCYEGFGYGRGFGRGRGRGYGFGYRNYPRHFGYRYYPVEPYYQGDVTNINDEEILKQQQSWLQSQLDGVSKRLKELAKSDKA